MSGTARAAPAGAGVAQPDPYAKRLRLCGWTGLVGLLAGLPLVFAMMFGGAFDAFALAAIAGWLMVAWLTRTCFRTAKALDACACDLPLGRLRWLAVVALVFPGLPILALAPWALAVGIGRLAQNMDPRELVFAAWGALGLVYFAVLTVILLTVRGLRRRARAR